MADLLTKQKELIITESDQILENFRNEINELNKRVNQLESERGEFKDVLEVNRQLGEHLSYQSAQGEQQQKAKSEEYQIVSHMVNDLTTPVDKVVQNLTQLKGEVQDANLQTSLQDCLDSAKQVLDSFGVAGNYLESFILPAKNDYTTIDLREFVKQVLQEFFKISGRLKLFVDQSVPTKVKVNSDLLNYSLINILGAVLPNMSSDGDLVVSITKKNFSQIGARLGLDITISIKSSQQTNLEWNGSWPESVAGINQSDKKNQIPLAWVSMRNLLQQSQGNLILEGEDGYLTTVHLDLPLYYKPPQI